MAAIIPENIILMLIGGESLPAGWSDVTPVPTSKLLRGTTVAEEVATSGGSNTHSHTFVHTHTQQAHTHTVTGLSAGGGLDAFGTITGTVNAASHSHGGATVGNATGTNLNNASASGSSNHVQPYAAVRLAKSDGTHGIQPGLIGFFAGTGAVPDSFLDCDGTSSTPDLRNKFLRPDGTSGGGASSHTHTSTHTHIQNAHGHDLSISSSEAASVNARYLSKTEKAVASHTHSATNTGSAKATNDSNSDQLFDDQTIIPAYLAMRALRNMSSQECSAFQGLIGMWSGSIESIPPSWILCDGNNGSPDLSEYFVRVVNSPADAGGSGGGSCLHTHSVSSHTHTSSAHSHLLVSGSASGSTYDNTDSSGKSVAASSHHHTVKHNATQITNDSAGLTSGEGDATPAWFKLAFIMYSSGQGEGISAIILPHGKSHLFYQNAGITDLRMSLGVPPASADEYQVSDNVGDSPRGVTSLSGQICSYFDRSGVAYAALSYKDGTTWESGNMAAVPAFADYTLKHVAQLGRTQYAVLYAGDSLWFSRNIAGNINGWSAPVLIVDSLASEPSANIVPNDWGTISCYYQVGSDTPIVLSTSRQDGIGWS